MLQTAMLERKVCTHGQAAFPGTSPYAQPSVFAGVGCFAVTFTVGGLSAINAVAGAYAEDLPVICITGVSTKCLHAQSFSTQQINCWCVCLSAGSKLKRFWRSNQDTAPHNC